MSRKKSKVTKILKNIKSYKCCPNFFVTGVSYPEREKLGNEIANKLIQKNAIDFKGIEKSFSVRMPYCNEIKDVDRFIAHLENSISIAQDCYDCYRGIVIVELENEWCTYESGTCIKHFFDFMKLNSAICFVILFPGEYGQEHCRFFYNEIADYGYWIHMETESPTIEGCIDLFLKTAKKSGYRVSDGVVDTLQELLKNRDQKHISNSEAVEHLVKRIIFERKPAGVTDREIVVDDIMCLSGQKSQRTQIGFSSSIR